MTPIPAKKGAGHLLDNSTVRLDISPAYAA